ncbi:hypothetical protein L596_021889 [Steinernema carpocapsae]|uniref:Uncharacterized protein n=1 Tax=Steinernema carpocapsae TaxID=34508 RepID=A0A4U5MK59_STECR|nr:hypothetical protein L596_021889 [Steinernema carpocapsae]
MIVQDSCFGTTEQLVKVYTWTYLNFAQSRSSETVLRDSDNRIVTSAYKNPFPLRMSAICDGAKKGYHVSLTTRTTLH